LRIIITEQLHRQGVRNSQPIQLFHAYEWPISYEWPPEAMNGFLCQGVSLDAYPRL
jgi:hypothetical protein